MHSFDDLVTLARIAPTPAPALRAAALAHWMHDSARGTSPLARDHANFAGLRWQANLRGHAVPVVSGDGDDTAYCEFTGAGSFIQAYWHSIGCAFSRWRAFAADPEGYIGYLAARWAPGDADYAGKVLALLPEAEHLLHGSAARPVRALPTPPPLPAIAEPERGRIALPCFTTVPDIRHDYLDLCTGPEGAIVHIPAPGSHTGGYDDPEAAAVSTLEWGAKNNRAFTVISETGRVYLPANMDWLAWGRHAGDSRCPATGRRDVSRFYAGIVMQGAGDPSRPASRAGTAQHEALIGLLLWLRLRFATTFRLGFVFNHGEVQPGGNTAPLRWTAGADLRAELFGRWAEIDSDAASRSSAFQLTGDIIRSACECRG